MKIRKYRPSDREQVEKIQFETGFIGKSMSPLLLDDGLWKRQISYYLEKEQKSILILEDDEKTKKVVGYLLGCIDDTTHNEVKVFVSVAFKGFFTKLFCKDRKFWWSQMKIIFKALLGLSKDARLKSPKNAGHIHINLLPKARGKGWGSKMMKKYFSYAKKKGSKIIHAESFQTKLNPNTNFWNKNGFKIFDKVRSELWKDQLPDEKIWFVTYVKKL